jgi:hypothetical protein
LEAVPAGAALARPKGEWLAIVAGAARALAIELPGEVGPALDAPIQAQERRGQEQQGQHDEQDACNGQRGRVNGFGFYRCWFKSRHGFSDIGLIVIASEAKQSLKIIAGIASSGKTPSSQ